MPDMQEYTVDVMMPGVIHVKAASPQEAIQMARSVQAYDVNVWIGTDARMELTEISVNEATIFDPNAPVTADRST